MDQPIIKNNNKNILYILFGILTFILLGVLVVYFFFIKKNPYTCSTDNCALPQTCVSNVCTPPYTCSSDNCQLPQTCVSNVCTQSGQKCDASLCPTWTKCDPVTGECYLPCSRLKCNDNEECRDSGPVIGKCVNKCDLIGNCEENKTCDRTLGKCVGKCDTVTCTAPQICNPITGICCTRNCIEGKCSDDDNCGGVCMCEEPLICDNISKECRSCSTDCTGLFCDERNECSITCGCNGEGQTCINKNCEPCVTSADCPFSDSNICGSDGKCQP